MLLSDGLNNWKLRLILSALLAIMGLGAMISMLLGLFVELSVYDKSLVAIAIFMVGIPTYLIISGLGQVDEFTIAGFLNETLDDIPGNAEILAKNEQELSEDELSLREQLIEYLNDHSLALLLPTRPVVQAYVLLLVSMVISFGIWFLG